MNHENFESNVDDNDLVNDDDNHYNLDDLVNDENCENNVDDNNLVNDDDDNKQNLVFRRAMMLISKMMITMLMMMITIKSRF